MTTIDHARNYLFNGLARSTTHYTASGTFLDFFKSDMAEIGVLKSTQSFHIKLNETLVMLS